VAERVTRKDRGELEGDDARVAGARRAKLNAEAYEAGADARRAGRGEDAMQPEYSAHRPLARAWLDGWRAPAPAIVHQPGGAQARPLHPSAVWPADKPLPTTYPRRRSTPCQLCRRLLTDHGGQAVTVRAIAGDVAYLSCRHCGEDFKLPVETFSG
jgi:hypothetical protein